MYLFMYIVHCKYGNIKDNLCILLCDYNLNITETKQTFSCTSYPRATHSRLSSTAQVYAIRIECGGAFEPWTCIAYDSEERKENCRKS